MTGNQISTDNKTALLNQVMSLRAELHFVTNERDAADERCAELERHNATLAEAVRIRTAIIRDMGAENRTLTARIRLAVAVLVILSVLALLYIFARPAAAQDDAHSVYIPLTAKPYRHWFSPDELFQAMTDAGYDPAVAAEHTWCVLDASADPAAGNIRYAYCFQNYVNGQPTDGNPAMYYYMNAGHVDAVLISSAAGSSVAAASSADPGCDANGNCG